MGLFDRMKERREKRKEKRDASGGILSKIKILTPMKAAMVLALKQKNVAISTNASLLDVVLTFADKILGRGEAVKKIRAKIASNTTTTQRGPRFIGHFDPVTLSAIAGIVSGIVKFFQELKKADDSGQLSADQSKVVKVAESGVDAVSEGVSSGRAGVATGDISRIFSEYGIYIFGGLILFAVFGQKKAA